MISSNWTRKFERLCISESRNFATPNICSSCRNILLTMLFHLYKLNWTQENEKCTDNWVVLHQKFVQTLLSLCTQAARSKSFCNRNSLKSFAVKSFTGVCEANFSLNACRLALRFFLLFFLANNLYESSVKFDLTLSSAKQSCAVLYSHIKGPCRTIASYQIVGGIGAVNIVVLNKTRWSSF